MKIRYGLLMLILIVFLSTSAVFADDLNGTDSIGNGEDMKINQISSEITDVSTEGVDENLLSTESSDKLSADNQNEDLLNVNEE